MKKSDIKLLEQVATQPDWVRSQIIKIWNSEAPHFGGDMPHRYDGASKACSYCNRPKNWKPKNIFFETDGKVSK